MNVFPLIGSLFSYELTRQFSQHCRTRIIFWHHTQDQSHCASLYWGPSEGSTQLWLLFLPAALPFWIASVLLMIQWSNLQVAASFAVFCHGFSRAALFSSFHFLFSLFEVWWGSDLSVIVMTLYNEKEGFQFRMVNNCLCRVLTTSPKLEGLHSACSE